MVLGDYTPSAGIEKHHYDELWKIIVNSDNNTTSNTTSNTTNTTSNTSNTILNGNESISGRKAVEFLRLSLVDSGILKQIWSLSTPTSTMNVFQFYSALRYITMVQNGEIPISKGKEHSWRTFFEE